jgi:hypothetical protein
MIDKLGYPMRCIQCLRLIQLGVDLHWYNYGTSHQHACTPACRRAA